MKLTEKKIIELLEKNQNIIKKYSVSKIALFGSFAKGNQSKKSDIDFLVRFEKETFDNYMDLKFFLEDLFKRKIDLVIEDNLKPGFEYVKTEAIYAKAI